MIYAFALRQLRYQGIDCLDSLISGARLSGENREDHDWSIRQAFPHFAHDGPDSSKNILRFVGRVGLFVFMQVVGANHQGDKPWGNPVEGSIVNPPENVLGSIAGETQVQQVAPIQNFRMFAPGMSDGVPNHHKIDLFVFCLIEFLLVELGHEFFKRRRNGNDR